MKHPSGWILCVNWSFWDHCVKQTWCSSGKGMSADVSVFDRATVSISTFIIHAVLSSCSFLFATRILCCASSQCIFKCPFLHFPFALLQLNPCIFNLQVFCDPSLFCWTQLVLVPQIKGGSCSMKSLSHDAAGVCQRLILSFGEDKVQTEDDQLE